MVTRGFHYARNDRDRGTDYFASLRMTAGGRGDRRSPLCRVCLCEERSDEAISRPLHKYEARIISIGEIAALIPSAAGGFHYARNDKIVGATGGRPPVAFVIVGLDPTIQRSLPILSTLRLLDSGSVAGMTEIGARIASLRSTMTKL
jgi:hypothetical protein